MYLGEKQLKARKLRCNITEELSDIQTQLFYSIKNNNNKNILTASGKDLDERLIASLARGWKNQGFPCAFLYTYFRGLELDVLSPRPKTKQPTQTPQKLLICWIDQKESIQHTAKD